MNVLNKLSLRLATFGVALVALVGASAASARVDAGSKLPPVANLKFAVAVAIPDPGQVFLYVPEGFGFFKAERLNVSVLFNNGGGAALQAVATGGADYGLSSPENLWNGIATGMPLRGFALVLTNSIYHNGIGVKADSPITSIAQLKGKKVGVSSFTSGSYPSAQAKVASGGLDPKKDVTFVPIGGGGTAANAAIATSSAAVFNPILLSSCMELYPPSWERSLRTPSLRAWLGDARSIDRACQTATAASVRAAVRGR
jgi:NitT/TauT family transport system substrate-binding protein